MEVRVRVQRHRAAAREIAHAVADFDHGEHGLPLLRAPPAHALHLRLANRPRRAGLMRLTFIHPAIGRAPGVNYMRTWQMEPLPIAVLAALTPRDVEVSFHDD